MIAGQKLQLLQTPALTRGDVASHILATAGTSRKLGYPWVLKIKFLQSEKSKVTLLCIEKYKVFILKRLHRPRMTGFHCFSFLPLSDINRF